MGDELTVEEALALSKSRRQQWALLAWEIRGGRTCPVYGCPNCGRQRYVLVSKNAREKVPAECPQCGTELSLPS